MGEVGVCCEGVWVRVEDGGHDEGALVEGVGEAELGRGGVEEGADASRVERREGSALAGGEVSER